MRRDHGVPGVLLGYNPDGELGDGTQIRRLLQAMASAACPLRRADHRSDRISVGSALQTLPNPLGVDQPSNSAQSENPRITMIRAQARRRGYSDQEIQQKLLDAGIIRAPAPAPSDGGMIGSNPGIEQMRALARQRGYSDREIEAKLASAGLVEAPRPSFGQQLIHGAGLAARGVVQGLGSYGDAFNFAAPQRVFGGQPPPMGPTAAKACLQTSLC